MNDNEVRAEWRKLCEEQAAARDAYFKAFVPVNQKFSAIGHEASRRNPTDNELTDHEETWAAWEDVRSRMREFVKRYA